MTRKTAHEDSPEAAPEGMAVREVGQADLDAARRLRFEGLDRDLGRQFDPTPDAQDEDPKTIHIGAFDGDTLVGTARLYPIEDVQGYFAQLVVVDEARRGQGIGTQMMRAAEAVVQQRGGKRIYLDAIDREEVIRFYERMGYQHVSYNQNKMVVILNGRPHLKMVKELSDG